MKIPYYTFFACRSKSAVMCPWILWGIESPLMIVLELNDMHSPCAVIKIYFTLEQEEIHSRFFWFLGDVCEADEFSCASGHPKCILSEYHCNGHNNCFDGSDEINCTSCSSWKFSCKSGNQCVYKSWQCDGDFDCTDHSDEENCNSTSSKFF